MSLNYKNLRFQGTISGDDHDLKRQLDHNPDRLDAMDRLAYRAGLSKGQAQQMVRRIEARWEADTARYKAMLHDCVTEINDFYISVLPMRREAQNDWIALTLPVANSSESLIGKAFLMLTKDPALLGFPSPGLASAYYTDLMLIALGHEFAAAPQIEVDLVIGRQDASSLKDVELKPDMRWEDVIADLPICMTTTDGQDAVLAAGLPRGVDVLKQTDHQVVTSRLKTPHPPAHDPPGFQSSWRLVKALSRLYGDKTGAAWRRLPLLYAADIMPTVRAQSEMIRASVPDLTYRPWHDVLIDCGWFETDAIISGGLGSQGPRRRFDLSAVPTRLYARVCSHARIVATQPLLMPWAYPVPSTTSYLGNAAFGDDTIHIGLFLVPDPRSVPDDHAPVAHLLGSTTVYDWPNTVILPTDAENVLSSKVLKETDEFTRELLSMALDVMAYLAQMPEMLVEVQPKAAVAPRNLARKPGHEPKPWTHSGPTIHLVDPRNIPPPRQATTAGGESGIHRFVRARRGGWVTLRHPRYYAWPHNERFIGDSEWFHAPPAMQAEYYRTGDYVCGVDAERRIRAFARTWVGHTDHWRELSIRRIYRRPFEWTGPTEGYEAADGALYRVLVRESDPEQPQIQEER